MKIKSFRDLVVWQKGHIFVLRVYRVTQRFPPEERFGLVNQIRRSASSVCANLCEGYKKSRKDFVRFIDIAQGSLEETKYHLILSRDLAFLSVEDYAELHQASEEIGVMLNGLKQKLLALPL